MATNTAEAIAAMDQTSADSIRRKADGAAASVLVAVASYGRKQDHYLDQVLTEYRKLNNCRIVVLSEAPKAVRGAEVLVGLPSSNTYSLPFAHRKLFAENVDKYDLFIYTEDDTVLTSAHIDAFIDLQGYLRDDEILGFIRSEITPTGERYITSANHFFRWLPETAETRGGELFAQFSNDHSGCFIATQEQLKRALASGRFLVEPHDEMYGMLESAASDIYRQCGLRRVLCVSRIQEFIVSHLANKYFMEMGITIEDLDLQLGVLRNVHEGSGWRGVLYEPESRAHSFRWSKDLYQKPDASLLRVIPPGTRRLLSVGVGSGHSEQMLSQNGIDVDVIAIDAIFAGALRAKGINAVEGPLDGALDSLGSKQFDTVLVTDVLQLVPDPVAWLRQLRERLTSDGEIVARVPNTGELPYWLKDLRAGRLRRRFPSYAVMRVQPVSRSRLRRWCRASNLQAIEITPLMDERRRSQLGRFAFGPLAPLLGTSFLLRAKPG